MKDAIRDFADAWARYDAAAEYSDNVAVDWASRFRDAGYYPAKLGQSLEQWQIAHDWCRENFGIEHYSWIGTVFWFDRQEDAVWFALRWS